MLNIAELRRDPQRFRRSALRRGTSDEFIEQVLELDRDYRATLARAQALKAQKNLLTGSIGRAADKAAQAAFLKTEIAALDEQISKATSRAPQLEERVKELLADVPNLLDDSVPDGSDESGNVVIRASRAPQGFAFQPRPHWEIGEALGILDFERAAVLSGSRFSVLLGEGARLSRAIVSYFLDCAERAGYQEVVPPFLVSRSTMWSTGQLTKFSDAMFMDQDADLFMIPTSEVPLAALHRDEILDAADLPLLYSAYSPCFRKEAGAAGKDTRGLMRQHQFEKVELVWLSAPEASFDALERLTADAERLLEELKLPYRVVALCAGDVGFNAAKTYDLEVWLPSQNMFREISSCSNCTDFQTRRANIRLRRTAQSKPELVHTLNGSGLAVGRTLVAILENYQQEDGSVKIPDVLQSYMRTDLLRCSRPQKVFSHRSDV
ncbi:MAG: serine--tRNA ligase [Candidatus Eremiobacteraeota bacterium]|nr:serine--tRNA ligase [Candidatus Eremiobacteraeota bacterium]